MAVEIPKNQVTLYASEQRVSNSEVRVLIERLFQELPEQERKAFYAEIRTSEMI